MISSMLVSDRRQTDSVFVHDSVYVRIRADTVWLEKWHTRWRDRFSVRTDTVQVETVRTETRQVRYVPRFYTWCAAVLAIVVLALLLRVASYLYGRFR